MERKRHLKEISQGSACFLGNYTKKWFLTNCSRENNTQGVHKHSKFWTNSSLLSKTINKKQVLVYGLLESTNDLRIIFVGHIHFKKLMIFQRFIEMFHCFISQEIRFLSIIVIDKNHINKGKNGKRYF